MCPDERRDMERWIEANRHDPDVLSWLERNPPPSGWSGTRMEWAWTEMPVGIFSGRNGSLL